MNDITIEENGVRKLLERINPHKAAGPDEISARILKEMTSSIALILTAIYQVSYNTGQAPDNWKKANVVPICKKVRSKIPQL